MGSWTVASDGRATATGAGQAGAVPHIGPGPPGRRTDGICGAGVALPGLLVGAAGEPFDLRGDAALLTLDLPDLLLHLRDRAVEGVAAVVSGPPRQPPELPASLVERGRQFSASVLELPGAGALVGELLQGLPPVAAASSAAARAEGASPMTR